MTSMPLILTNETKLCLKAQLKTYQETWSGSLPAMPQKQVSIAQKASSHSFEFGKLTPDAKTQQVYEY